MKLKQISIPMENVSARLLEVTKAFGENGINLKALTLVDTGDFGELRVLVSDVSNARQVLMKREIPGRVEEVVAVEMKGNGGQLARFLETIEAARLRVKYSYAFTDMKTEQGGMVFCFDDNNRAMEVLAGIP